MEKLVTKLKKYRNKIYVVQGIFESFRRLYLQSPRSSVMLLSPRSLTGSIIFNPIISKTGFRLLVHTCTVS